MLEKTKEIAAKFRLALIRLEDSKKARDSDGTFNLLREIFQLQHDWYDLTEEVMSAYDADKSLVKFLDLKECTALRKALFWVFDQMRDTAKLVAIPESPTP